MQFTDLPESDHPLVRLRPIEAADIDWAHGHVGLLRVQATALDSNARSMKVLERCGFQREGLLHSYRLVRGRPGAFWMYAHVVPPGAD